MWTRKALKDLQVEFGQGMAAPPLPARTTAVAGGKDTQEDEDFGQLSIIYDQCTKLDPRERSSAEEVLKTLESILFLK